MRVDTVAADLSDSKNVDKLAQGFSGHRHPGEQCRRDPGRHAARRQRRDLAQGLGPEGLRLRQHVPALLRADEGAQGAASSSTWSAMRPTRMIPEYICGVAGNAALTAFSQSLGCVSAKDGIRVIALSPGPVETDRIVTLMKKKAKDRTGRRGQLAGSAQAAAVPALRHAGGNRRDGGVPGVAAVRLHLGLGRHDRCRPLGARNRILRSEDHMPHLTTDDGVKLYYEETGKGMPIVFVHEFAGDYRSWEPQVRYFARHYRCIAYNARGYPPSDVPKDGEKYSQDRARDDIRAVLDALKIDKAHVVGLSMGGFATLHFGFTYPRARALAGGRRLRLRRRAGQARSSSRRRPRRRPSASRSSAWRRPPRPTRSARRACSSRTRTRAAGAEFADQLAEHSTDGAALTMRGVQARRPSLLRAGRQDEDDHGADADHDRRRGLALPRAGRADEAEHPDRRRWS